MNDLPWNLRTTTAPLGIAGRVSDAKQIRDAGGVQALHICPATGNAPTRMTRVSWERLCAATQRKSLERECIDKNQAQLMRMTRRLNVCAWCRGEILPRGLEFIDAAEMAELSKPKEEAMAKQSKLGVCENCGDKGALAASFGRRVCTTCLKIRSGVNSHIERVAAAARDMGRAPELLAALVPDGGGLAIKVTADLLQEISGIVGYDGEDPAELVEAVRRRALACVSCDAEDVLHEIREIIGYAPDQGDRGLADAVRVAVSEKKATALDCGDCDLAHYFNELTEQLGQRGASTGQVVEAVRRMALREASSECPVCADLKGDLLRACDLDLDLGKAQDWDYVATAAIQEIAGLTNRKNFWIEAATELKAKVVELNELIGIGEAKLILAEQAEANVADQAAELNVDDTRLRDELARAGAEVEQLRNRAQESESRLIWYREALAVLRDRLGLDHLGEDEDVVERMLEAIASQAQALTRFQDLSRAADVRADEVEAELAQARSEINGLRDAVHGGQYGQAALLDIALAALRGDALRGEAVAGLIEVARRWAE